MHDIVIRGGTIIDGSGNAPFSGDLAIDGDRIVQVGGKAGPGRREMNAEGLHVTPGWVDIHTHYEGRRPGTRARALLCARRDHAGLRHLRGRLRSRGDEREALIDLMEGVEEVPGVVLSEGMALGVGEFHEYLAALANAARPWTWAQAAPRPLRVYVMGERALRREAATPEDIAVMQWRWAEQAMAAGAFGITTSPHQTQHKTLAGELVPGSPRRCRGAHGPLRGRWAQRGDAARLGLERRFRQRGCQSSPGCAPSRARAAVDPFTSCFSTTRIDPRAAGAAGGRHPRSRVWRKGCH